ncbi:hypothetical protein (plasmid) [Thermus thermophilus HB8]|uniref:Uncharacterized protein n=1 Tax=Thermus thermophilus (strain ATCC 27634 / DSM 579 / HB8) TaxID=300852 RepID=Q5SGM8_THET8|nr:hypothetical protein [Thermus thermophilus HB8]
MTSTFNPLPSYMSLGIKRGPGVVNRPFRGSPVQGPNGKLQGREVHHPLLPVREAKPELEALQGPGLHHLRRRESGAGHPVRTTASELKAFIHRYAQYQRRYPGWPPSSTTTRTGVF